MIKLAFRVGSNDFCTCCVAFKEKNIECISESNEILEIYLFLAPKVLSYWGWKAKLETERIFNVIVNCLNPISTVMLIFRLEMELSIVTF